MRAVLFLTSLGSAYATTFGVVTANDANPPPYEVYNIAIENSSPSAAAVRRGVEEQRSETTALTGIAESRSRADKALEGLLAIDAMHKQQASFLAASGASEFPVVEVSLASPSNPHPSVAAKISSLEKNREDLETRKLSALRTAYASILTQAKAQIVSALSGKKSFLKMNPIEPSVQFNLVPSNSDDSAAGSAIESMEAKRNAAEAQILDSAISELGEFAKVYVAELVKGISARGSFLHAVPSTAEGFHRQINIKLLPNDSFASVSHMVANMEKRRDISEASIRSAILDMEMSLAKSLNAFAAATFKAAL